MSEYIRLQANGADAYPDASTENTYRPNGTSVESALVNLESNVTTLGGVAGEAKTLAEQNSVKIATAEQEISDINSSLNIVSNNLENRITGPFQIINSVYIREYNEFVFRFKDNPNSEYYYQFVISENKYRFDKVTSGEINTIFIRNFV